MHEVRVVRYCAFSPYPFLASIEDRGSRMVAGARKLQRECRIEMNSGQVRFDRQRLPNIVYMFTVAQFYSLQMPRPRPGCSCSVQLLPLPPLPRESDRVAIQVDASNTHRTTTTYTFPDSGYRGCRGYRGYKRCPEDQPPSCTSFRYPRPV